MRVAYRNNKGSFLKQVGWWIFFLISAFYGVFALYMGVVEVLSLAGVVEDAPHRAVPVVFVLHALSGGLALISGPLQFNRLILSRRRRIHRIVGRLYLGAIWISSLGALWSAIFFDVTLAAKLAFGLLSILWFGTTTIAYLRIRARQVKEHREWMIRSFALSLFFVTFSFWVPGLASTSLPEEIGYPLAIFLSWSLNLLLAELWMRRSRTRFSNRGSAVERV
jgi:uncharacterized membrane protein